MRLGALFLLAALAVTAARDDDVVKPAIVNGYDAPRNRYPWMVSLRANDGRGDWHFCMGVLIQESIVMTAASCVRDPLTGKNLPNEYYYPLVRIGGYLRLTDRPDAYQLRKVVETLVHPHYVTGYVDNNSNNDIALLLLDKPSTKEPVALPPFKPKPELPWPKNTQLFAAGWGWTDALVPSEAERLQQISMTLLALARCQRDWGVDVLVDRSTSPPTNRTVRTNFATNTMLCAAQTGRTEQPNGGPCFGDGGAPYFRRPRGAGPFTVYGLNSYGPRRCGRGSYVFTDVAALRRWIDQSVDALTRSDWTGRVWGDPNVLGFDGSRFQTTTPAGYALTILAAPGKPLSLVADLARHPKQPRLTVMCKVTFRWGAEVVCGFRNGRTYVTVNGRTLRPGQRRQIPGGSVRYRETKVRWSQQIVIEQPGMSIRINRVWDSRRNSFWDWFDIWVFLTRAPRWPLTGVLGSTFPRPQAGAAGAAAASAGGGGGGSSDLVGGFVLPVATPKNRG